MFYRNLKIGQKIFIFIVTTIICIGAVGFTGYHYINQMAKSSSSMYEERLQPIKWLMSLRINNRVINASLMELMITTDQNRNKELHTNITEKVKENTELIAFMDKVKFEGKALEDWKKIKSSYDLFVETITSSVDLAMDNRNVEAYDVYLNKVKKLQEDVNFGSRDLSTDLENIAAEVNTINQQNLSKAVLITIIIIAVALALSIIIGIVINRNIVNPIKEIQKLMKEAELGDLTVKSSYVSKDEVGQLSESFSNMLEGIRKVMTKVTITSETVSSSAEELMASAEQTSRSSEVIASTIQEVASGTNQQVKSVAETAQTMKELSGGVQQISRNAQQVSETTIETARKVDEGNTAVQSAVSQMMEIQRNVNSLAQVVKNLGAKSGEINKISEVISQLSAQTNLLALDAAIEAARAGEYGRGFAVVADEVRKLAEESTASAQQISTLIGGIQQETDVAVTSMVHTVDEVASGIELVSLAGNSFEEINSAMGLVTGQIHQVTAAVQQMLAGTEQVAEAVNQISAFTETTAGATENVSAATEEQLASMQEINSASTSLTHMAEELSELVSTFKV